jgi:hypothetical protein
VTVNVFADQRFFRKRVRKESGFSFFAGAGFSVISVLTLRPSAERR